MFALFLPLNLYPRRSLTLNKQCSVEFLLCRYCGSDVSISNFFLNKVSPYALSASNQSFYNQQQILVQTLENSLGVQFNVAIVQKANCAAINIRASYSFDCIFCLRLFC